MISIISMNKTNKSNKTKLYRCIAVLFALALWQIVSMLVANKLLLSSPISVIKRLSTLIFESDFLMTVLYSLLRMSIGFLIAFVFGVIFAFVAGRFKFVEYLLWPFVITVKSVPVASFIILFLIWMNFSVITVLISFLISFPVIYNNVLQGINSTDSKLKEVAQLYKIPWNRRLIYMYIPSIKPFLLSACSVGVAMSWKAGIAAEVIGKISGSIGGKLYESKLYLENADLCAWTILIIALSMVCEKLFNLLLRACFRRIEKI